MLTLTGPTGTARPTTINGVALYRRDGRPRRHFGEEERLAILGGHEEELDVFLTLFARRQVPFIVQKETAGERTGWDTVRHRLRRDDVVKHLLADRLTGTDPVWYGTRAWEKTPFVAIDVDLRDDHDDFWHRCHEVETALLVLGIPRRSLLAQKSPSGGRHYYFFPHEPVPTEEIQPVLELVGLRHCKGKYEAFPSETQGFRLPFGHVPGQPHDPNAWLRFIRAYLSGEFPRVNWSRCRKRAEGSARRRLENMVTHSIIPARQATGRSSGPLRRRAEPSHGAPATQSPSGEELCGRRPEPRVSRVRSPVDVEHLRRVGIEAEGTRVQWTKYVAWNAIFVRGMSVDEASDEITELVYRTGKETSKDVRRDLAEGSRRVAEQTREIVEWFATQRDEGGHQGGRRFSPREIDKVIDRVLLLPAEARLPRLRFVVDFLNFAKRNGSKQDDGWACCPSVRGIIRKWNGCSGMRYKPHLDWAMKVGLIEMIREKWQSKGRKGRARTYAIHIPSRPYEERTLTYSAAIEYGKNRITQPDASQAAAFLGLNESDTYKKIVTPKEGDNESETSNPRSESICEGTEETRRPDRESITVTDPQGLTFERIIEGREERDAQTESGGSWVWLHAQGENVPRECPSGKPRYLHPWGADRDLVQGSAEFVGLGDGLQTLCYSPPAGEQTVLGAGHRGGRGLMEPIASATDFLTGLELQTTGVH